MVSRDGSWIRDAICCKHGVNYITVFKCEA
jgi:hypothetical protein